MDVSVKAVIFIAAILIIIVASSILTGIYLQSSSQKITYYIEDIEKNTKDKDWEKAEKTLSALESYWSKTKSRWSMLIDHHEIDNIDTSLAKMSAFIEQREQMLALAELSTLKQMVRHIPKKEAPGLENIF